MSMIITPNIIKSTDNSDVSDIRVWSSLKTIEEIEKRRNNNFRVWSGDVTIVGSDSQLNRSISATELNSDICTMQFDSNINEFGTHFFKDTTNVINEDKDITDVSTYRAKYIQIKLAHDLLDNILIPSGGNRVGTVVVERALRVDRTENPEKYYDENVFVESCVVEPEHTLIRLGNATNVENYFEIDDDKEYIIKLKIRSERFIL